MYKAIMILPFTILLTVKCKSQDHGGVQQYYYSGDGASSIVPKIYYQSNNNWYGDVRYNYEEMQTLSLNAGKTFSRHGNMLSYSITPVAGLVLGKLNGISIGTNVETDYRDLFFSAESQYTFSTGDRSRNLFFNWSECGYQFTNRIYGGMALQVTHYYDLKNIWEPGIMMGLTYRNWTFPVYFFSPFSSSMNFVTGINWDWTHGK
jgi:hypothetical protein